MAEGHDDGSLAPRRRLGGPILPPPPPQLAENARKTEADKASAERADAEKHIAREVLAAQKAHAEQHARSSAESRARAKAAAKAETKVQTKVQAKLLARAQAKAQAKAQAEAQATAQTQAQATGQTGAETWAQSGAGTGAEAGAGGNTERTAESGAVPMVGASAGAAPGSASQQAGSPERQASQAKPASKRIGPRRTRRAQLRLVQVDAWSVMKTSFLLSVALGIVLVVAVSIIWSVLGAAGVWESINSIVQQAVGSTSGKPFDIQEYAGTSRVMGLTMIVAVLDVILITAIATLGAFLYNLSAALLGGIEVTLAEDG